MDEKNTIRKVDPPVVCPSCGGVLIDIGYEKCRCKYCGNLYDKARKISVTDYLNSKPRRDNLGGLLSACEWQIFEKKQLIKCGGLINSFDTYAEFDEFFDDPAYRWWNKGRGRLCAKYVVEGAKSIKVEITPEYNLLFEGGLSMIKSYNLYDIMTKTKDMNARDVARTILDTEIQNAADGVWSYNLFGSPLFCATLKAMVSEGKIIDKRKKAESDPVEAVTERSKCA